MMTYNTPKRHHSLEHHILNIGAARSSPTSSSRAIFLGSFYATLEAISTTIDMILETY